MRHTRTQRYTMVQRASLSKNIHTVLFKSRFYYIILLPIKLTVLHIAQTEVNQITQLAVQFANEALFCPLLDQLCATITLGHQPAQCTSQIEEVLTPAKR